MPVVPARPWLRTSLDFVHVALTALAFCLVWTARNHGAGSVRDFLDDGGLRMWELQLATAGFALMTAACLPLGGTRSEVVGCVGAAVTLVAWYCFAGSAIAVFPIMLIPSVPYLVAVSLFGVPRYRAILARRRSRRRGFEVGPANGQRR
jgi:hypothetical protein